MEKNMQKTYKGDFNSWLTARIRTASNGLILSFDTGKMVPVDTARADVFLEHTKRRAEFNKTRHAKLIESLARDQAEADPNDPFAYQRAKTHLEGGLCGMDDYGVEFGRLPVEDKDITGKVIGTRMARSPMKMRRP